MSQCSPTLTRWLIKVLYNGGMEMIAAADDGWKIVEGVLNDVKTQIRYRHELNIDTYKNKFRDLLTIIWVYEPNDIDQSLPHLDDLEPMQSFEVALTDSFEEAEVGTLAFVYTAKGQREFGFYISSVDSASDIINSTLVPDLPIDISLTNDDRWSEFQGILDLVG